jgi:anaerobic magnesium-protoporphyrin IX monomethyl ester cyclase
VLDELLDLHARLSFEEVFFLDDDLFANRRRLVEICRLLRLQNPGFGWKGTARADELCRMNDEALADIRSSGCRRINVGAESGSQTMLDRIKKKYAVEQLVEAGQRCRRHGIKLTYSFIAGFPGEPEESLDQTVALIRRLKEIDADFETPIYCYVPYPGTELSAELEQAGWRHNDRLEDWFSFDFRKEHYPWMRAGYVRKVRNLNFYLKKAYPGTECRGAWRRILGTMARWRLQRGLLDWPVERQAHFIWSNLRRFANRRGSISS